MAFTRSGSLDINYPRPSAPPSQGLDFLYKTPPRQYRPVSDEFDLDDLQGSDSEVADVNSRFGDLISLEDNAQSTAADSGKGKKKKPPTEKEQSRMTRFAAGLKERFIPVNSKELSEGLGGSSSKLNGDYADSEVGPSKGKEQELSRSLNNLILSATEHQGKSHFGSAFRNLNLKEQDAEFDLNSYSRWSSQETLNDFDDLPPPYKRGIDQKTTEKIMKDTFQETQIQERIHAPMAKQTFTLSVNLKCSIYNGPPSRTRLCQILQEDYHADINWRPVILALFSEALEQAMIKQTDKETIIGSSRTQSVSIVFLSRDVSVQYPYEAELNVYKPDVGYETFINCRFSASPYRGRSLLLNPSNLSLYLRGTDDVGIYSDKIVFKDEQNPYYFNEFARVM